MVLAFLMGVDFTTLAILGVLLFLLAFSLSKKLYTKIFKGNHDKIIVWSIITSIILVPILFAIIFALIVVGFMTYEKFQIISEQ
jgi:hypothetical protein